MLSGKECKAARAGLDWSRDQLAERSGVGKRTIIDFENEVREPISATRQAIKLALESAGAEFKDGKVCVPVSR
ncbi:helix-turn-helix transcriptional regulator [Labrenzia sp. C1B10]|nr:MULTISPECIES: helix-turn-helix transcriptional regulator [unclassified Labrenzia]